MNRKQLFFTVLIIVILALTFFVVLAPTPERFSVQSSDGVLTIDGIGRESQNLTIEPLGDQLYPVEPSGGLLTEPFTLTFVIPETEEPFPVAAYRYEDEVMMWERLENLSLDEQTLEIEAYQLGLFTLRESVEVRAPDFVSTFDELLLLAPEGTVGVEMAVGYITQDGSVIRLTDKNQIGGCGGVLLRGNTTEISQLTEDARVLVDDVETDVEFLFLARWFINDIEGCQEGITLELAS